MIEPFWGEFMISPIPLELSLNKCSHACRYCFANLNGYKGADVKKLMRFLADYQNRETLEATLLKAGYPVLISNRSDPFSRSNYRQMMPILDTLGELDIPVSLQTKGGPGAKEVAAKRPGMVWYISISTLDDNLRARLEPAAPSIQERFELIEIIREYGGHVVLGLNPCVPEWLPDPAVLLRHAAFRGVEGVWVEELHLNYNQIAAMSELEKAAIGPELLTRSQLRKRAKADSDHFFKARYEAESLGLSVFSNGQPTKSDIWDIYRSVYPKTFPTNQDFVNFCHENNLGGGVIPFDVYFDVTHPFLPGGMYRMSKYLGASSRSIWETYNIPSKLTFRDLLMAIWKIKRAKQSPARMPSFAYATVSAQTGPIQLVDASDLPWLAFDENGNFESYYTEVVPEWPQAVDIG